ncbi:hypothetical protein [Streptomyces lunaelactis]|uniref:hypothetical protein n=1 Tax=Streptomyces lunaelactis TaxID=1535768 RepID=UPI001584A0E9|nr:hypothetical protein [Streptomyces lunaelactis]NUK89970.1 hypothetical protein [Streptomyces lunaelactis]
MTLILTRNRVSIRTGAVQRDLLGGTVDAGVYHRRALLHVHGGGPGEPGRGFNVAVWALACAWRGLDIPYGLYGTAVVTGPGDGRVAGLEAGLVVQVRAVCAAVRDVLAEWQTRPPAGESAARSELLAAARHQVKATAPAR